MPKDGRIELVNAMEQTLIMMLPSETVQMVMETLVDQLAGYEILERCTDIVKTENMDEKLIKTYIACLMVDGKSERTISQYCMGIRKMLKVLQIPIVEIGTFEIRYFLAIMKKNGVSNVTLENYRSYISAFYTWLTNEGVIETNPCVKIKPVKCRQEIKFPYSDTEIDRLRSACKNDKDRALIEVLLSSGLRVAELSLADIKDVDFQRRTVHVRHGKGDKERIVYITPVAAMHLKRYIDGRKDDNPSLICARGGRRASIRSVQDLLKRLGKEAGVDNVHPHRFRRTFATTMYNAGMDLHEIQRLMGHAKIETTIRYIYTTDMQIGASYKRFAS